jgi:hypothetical protein
MRHADQSPCTTFRYPAEHARSSSQLAAGCLYANFKHLGDFRYRVNLFAYVDFEFLVGGTPTPICYGLSPFAHRTIARLLLRFCSHFSFSLGCSQLPLSLRAPARTGARLPVERTWCATTSWKQVLIILVRSGSRVCGCCFVFVISLCDPHRRRQSFKFSCVLKDRNEHRHNAHRFPRCDDGTRCRSAEQQKLVSGLLVPAYNNFGLAYLVDKSRIT